MRILFSAIIAFLLVAGCVTRHVVDDFDSRARYFNRINTRANIDGKVKIIFIDGHKVKTDSLFVAADSSHYLNKKNRMISVHNAFVEKVVFFKRGKGALQGLIVGPAAFTLAAIALLFSDSDTVIDGDEPALRSFGEFVGFVTFSAAAGAGLGLVIGTLNGQREVFPIREAYQQFNNSPYTQQSRY